MKIEGVCSHDHLRFCGWIGAPGYGQAWECDQCGEALWSPGGPERVVPYADLDRPPELDIEDIR